MSAAEIIVELPKLTEWERRAVSRRLLELAAENEDDALADASLVEACQQLDRREADDAQAKSVSRRDT